MVRIYLSDRTTVDAHTTLEQVREILQPGATESPGSRGDIITVSIIPNSFVQLGDQWINPHQVVRFHEVDQAG